MIRFDNKMLEKKILRAKETGAMDLAGLDLPEIPDKVIGFENVTLEGQKWWTAQPLTKLNISNNQIK
jgi:hypothetical protein